MRIGYCTNVHAGANFEQAKENLTRYALEVKQRYSPSAPMGVGLWLSASSARDLIGGEEVEPFRDWLGEHGLIPFTFNGFPFGDFHQEVVKHQVYLPTWAEEARVEHTSDLIRLLDALLERGKVGSISTLPLAWGEPALGESALEEMARGLHRIAEQLARLEREQGRRIVLAIEPEPGCALQRSEDLVRFFEDHLFRTGDEDRARRYLGICHDVCHAVVMFEEQEEVLRRYRDAGIRVGKVQVSSAPRLVLDGLSKRDRESALTQLEELHEPRYLHQTVYRAAPDREPRFFENLPLALDWLREQSPEEGEVRVHFHVPIYLERFGLLEASPDAVRECVQGSRAHSEVEHFEIETYSWNVLPEELKVSSLAEGIAEEMRWFASVQAEKPRARPVSV